MERVHLDFLGLLPRIARGNEYVLVMVDQWVECIPLPSQMAKVTATATAAFNELRNVSIGIYRCGCLVTERTV